MDPRFEATVLAYSRLNRTNQTLSESVGQLAVNLDESIRESIGIFVQISCLQGNPALGQGVHNTVDVSDFKVELVIARVNGLQFEVV